MWECLVSMLETLAMKDEAVLQKMTCMHLHCCAAIGVAVRTWGCQERVTDLVA